MRRFFAKKREAAPASAPDAAPSSASSSSGSDHTHLPIPLALPPKRTWKPWTAAKRSLSLKSSHSRTTLPDWSDAPPLPGDPDPYDSDDDDASYHAPAPAPLPAPPPPPPDPARAVQVMRLLLASASIGPPPVSPFVQHHAGPVFPRSINPPSRLPPPPANTRVAMFRAHLAARLRAADLPPADTAAILPLAARPLPVPLPPSSHPHDISRPPNTTKVFQASPGLRRWIARPCFEDRHLIYCPGPSGIESRPVSSSWAIAALEYSEHLDVMVDPDFDHPPPQLNVPDAPPALEPTLAATHSHASLTDHALVSASPHNRNSYTAIPSPLRNEHAPSPALPPAPSKSADPPPNPKLSTVKRVVRFLEDDSDDGMPLHVVRMKKKREEKSNFLRQEQIKRARDEDVARRQEAQRLQQEALEKERQRLAIEKERREKEKALYTEQVLAARARRELSRAGGTIPSNTASNNNLLVPSSSISSLRDAERNKSPPSESRRYSRANHDAPPSISIPRREASEFGSHLNSHPSNHFSDSSSPDSSRPPSLAYSPGSPAQGHSRPPSTYSAHTSSSEDVRHQPGSKRNSLAPSVAAPSYARPPIIANYASWSGSNPNIHYVPPVPPFPDYITDMPLLPPTAPFMKHSRPRSTSSSRKDSSPGPSTSSSRRGSFNSSSERVNLVPKSPGSSSSRNPSSSPRPPQQRHASTPVKPTHERRMSSDSRATAQTHNTTQTHRQSSHYQQSPRPAPVSSRSHPVLSRGRPEQPAWAQAQAQYLQVAPMNPWMNGGIPMAMAMPMSVPVGMPYMAVPMYPMMPMMGGGPQMGLHGAHMGTPRRDGGTQARKEAEQRALAIS